MSESQPLIDPKDLRIIAVGFVLGWCIIGLFILLGLGIHQTMSIHFGIPYQ